MIKKSILNSLLPIPIVFLSLKYDSKNTSNPKPRFFITLMGWPTISCPFNSWVRYRKRSPTIGQIQRTNYVPIPPILPTDNFLWIHQVTCCAYRVVLVLLKLGPFPHMYSMFCQQVNVFTLPTRVLNVV